MPVQRVTCPQCKTPIAVEVRQIFDVQQDPMVKQMVLGGYVNVFQCPVCGFVGQVPAPVVYHDAEKELLLVYVPQELGLRQEDQERVVGPLLRQIMQRLPAEKRKAYLLRPQYFLSFRSLQERILEAEGISKEEIEAQEKRYSLLQRLLATDDETRRQILQQEQELIDGRFWDLLTYTMEVALAQQNESLARQLQHLQELILEHTEFGQKLRQERQIIEACLEFARRLPKQLSPQALVDRLLAWPQLDEKHLRYLVTLVLPQLLEYEVFQALREREAQGSVEQRARAQQVRTWLTRILDQVQDAQKRFEQQLTTLFQKAVEVAHNEHELNQAVEALTYLIVANPQFSMEVLGRILQNYTPGTPQYAQAEKVLQRLEARLVPPEVRLLRQLLDTHDPGVWKALLHKHREAVNPTLLQLLSEEFASRSPQEQEALQPLVDMVAQMVMERQMEEAAQKKAEAQTARAQAQGPRLLKPGEEEKPQGPSQLILPS